VACVDVPRSPRAILELSEGRPFFPRPLWVAERSSLFSYPSHVCGVETSRARSGVARSAGWGCVIHTHTNGPPPCTSFAPLTICFPSPQVGGMKTAVSETRAPSFSLRSASPSPRKRARLALSYPSPSFWARRATARPFLSLPLLWGGWHIVSGANDVTGGGCFRKPDISEVGSVTTPHPALRHRWEG
jgi:hypothetical protein